MHELHVLVEAGLVEPIQGSQVDLQPPQLTFAQRLCLVEDEQVATEVRRDLVCMAAEVEVMGELEGVTKELRICVNRVMRQTKYDADQLRSLRHSLLFLFHVVARGNAARLQIAVRVA